MSDWQNVPAALIGYDPTRPRHVPVLGGIRTHKLDMGAAPPRKPKVMRTCKCGRRFEARTARQMLCSRECVWSHRDREYEPVTLEQRWRR